MPISSVGELPLDESGNCVDGKGKRAVSSLSCTSESENPFDEMRCATEFYSSRFDPVWSMSGEFCLEVFSGVGVLTLGLMFSSLPCLRPWDTLGGPQFDVLEIGQVIVHLILLGRLAYVHLAPPCQSFSFGRLPALGNAQYPTGIPQLSLERQPLVDSGIS